MTTTLTAQNLYALRDRDGDISGDELSAIFAEICGDPSPAGRTPITPAAIIRLMTDSPLDDVQSFAQKAFGEYIARRDGEQVATGTVIVEWRKQGREQVVTPEIVGDEVRVAIPGEPGRVWVSSLSEPIEGSDDLTIGEAIQDGRAVLVVDLFGGGGMYIR